MIWTSGMSWHCAILIESDVALFDTAEENLEQELQQELRQECFSIMNLNARQSLILFQDVYCDYQLVANHIYNFLKREYMERFYLAVSRKFDGCESLPSVLEQLEQQMEEKFYHPDKHVFTNEDEVLWTWQSERCRILSSCRRFPRISPARI